MSRGGGIGIHACLRSMCRKAWRFESSPRYHKNSQFQTGSFLFAKLSSVKKHCYNSLNMEKKSPFRPSWPEEQPGTETVKPANREFIATHDFPNCHNILRVTSIAPNSAADKAGMKVGDLVLSLNGLPVTVIDFGDLIQELNGQESELVVLRSGEKIRLPFTPLLNKTSNRWSAGITMEYSEEEDILPELLSNQAENITFSIDLGKQQAVKGYCELADPESAGQAAREIKKYCIFYTGSDGKEYELDLLAEINPVKVKCFYDHSISQDDGSYDHSTKTLKTGQLTSLQAIFTLAHELRHAYQFSNMGEFKDFKFELMMYAYSKGEHYQPEQKVFDAILRREPLSVLSRALISANLFEDIEDAEIFMSGYISSKITASTKLFDEITAADILHLPRFYLERDADYGALRSLMAIKQKTGLDLHGTIPAATKMMASPDNPNDISEINESNEEIFSLQRTRDHMYTLGFDIEKYRKIKRWIKSYKDQKTS
jgi:hypothetical protein